MQNFLCSPPQWLTTLTAVLLLAVLPACASTGAANGGGENAIRVQVDNNLVPSTTVSISAVTQAGSPMRLGSVIAGGEHTFSFEPLTTTGTFRLVADPPGPSGQLISDPIVFPADGAALIKWGLATNSLLVE